MKTPEEIKVALKHCSTYDGCSADCPYSCCDVDSGALERDALAYIQRLEAELIATRVRLGKDGDLCRICCTQRAQDCAYDCDNCDNAGCGCKRCIDTDGIEGFEWDGGAT